MEHREKLKSLKKIKIFSITILLVIILFPRPLKATYQEKIAYTNYILVNRDTKQILLENEADEKVAIASLTKIMTVVIALENNPDLNRKITITAKMLKGLKEADASIVGFKVGDSLTVLDLIYGALLPSGADATRALALSISDSEEEFSVLMNEKAAELGMINTFYKNSSGLDVKGQYSSAYDQMLLLEYALNNNEFVKAFTAINYKTTNDLKLESSFRRYLKRYEVTAPIISGAKTGYTDDAGVCLASYVDLQGDHLIFIGLGNMSSLSKARKFSDDIKIYNYYTENYGLMTLYNKEDILFIFKPFYTVKKEVNIYFPEDFLHYLPKDYLESDISLNITNEERVDYNTKSGAVIAEYDILYQDKVIHSGTVELSEQLKTNLILRGLEFSENNQILTVSCLFGLDIVLIVIFIFNRKRKRFE